MHAATTLLAVAASVFVCATAVPTDSFLPPVAGVYAANSDLVTPTTLPTVQDCAQRCLSNSACISFNVCENGGPGLDCGISGWNMGFVASPAASCSWYRLITPRNDAPIKQAVPWQLTVPQSGVAVSGGPLAATFEGNVNNYLSVRDPLDMLHFFSIRAGKPVVGQCFGWDEWIKGSATGNFLMGAGSALRYTDNAVLRANVQTVADGIVGYADPVTGWVWAFNESDIGADNLPDYCASWVTRGLLDAASSGASGALDIARQSVSVFNNHSQLPFFLPPNGGPDPVQPYPSGFNNVTSGGYGQATGHMIYIEYQGMIKHTLMALSGAGTQADVDIVADHYQEDWWLEALLAKDLYHGMWHRQFFSHNYEITAFEAFLDMYVLTGNTTYLTAMLNAWEMLRENFILPGSGSLTINEGDYYPPQSYYIGNSNRDISTPHGHGPTEDDPYFHAPCMPGPLDGTEHMSPLSALKHAATHQQPGATRPPSDVANPNDNDPPTGELCGSVFWAGLNQRFHRLYPDNETFVWEIERSILNVGVAALGPPGSGGQGPNGTGIRYFANQHAYKQNPSMHASCCEGQGTRLFGSLPGYIYSTVQSNDITSAVYVDLYAASSINFTVAAGAASLTQDTLWPYGSDVKLILSLPAAGALDIAVRIPAWTAGGLVTLTVNGKAWSTLGAAGSYVHVSQAWPAGFSSIVFTLPMELTSWNYTGLSQLPPFSRWGFNYGPVQLAAVGSWSSSVSQVVMPAGLDPATPQAWLVPAADGNTLHWNVTGAPGLQLIPYYEVQAAGTLFDTFPCFV